jgi:organic hydroperoxide reductase OsmC/OhrA
MGNTVTVKTSSVTQSLVIPAKGNGRGSSVNGGEFLMLALATCFCNDLYREADRLQIPVDGVEVEATADFPGVGLVAQNITYRVRVNSKAGASVIAELLRQTDMVAEVRNTVRAGARVMLVG